jgi:MoxR-like ATPase
MNGPTETARTLDPRLALAKAENYLNARFLERREEVRGLLLGLVTGENVLLLGPPGSAKSELSDALCSVISGGDYFYSLLTRTSTPEDLFGPYSIAALEQDSYRRKTIGYLPSATIAFIDEIFKSNSATLNGLLPVLNERVFVNDGRREKLPLEMVVAASNELPAEREELDALWDRFMLRFQVSYLKEEKGFLDLLGRAAGGGVAAAHESAKLCGEDLDAARDGARSVDASPVVPALASLKRSLEEAGVRASDRRYVKALSLVKANAFLSGRDEATEEDLAPLAHALWQDPSQIRPVRKAVLACANPYLEKARELLDEAEEVHASAMASEDANAANAGNEANKKLKGISDRLLSELAEARNVGRDAAGIKGALSKVEEMKKQVLKHCFGMDL